MKKELGQYFTTNNFFSSPIFIKWIKSIHQKIILEPFAGNKDIVNHLLKIEPKLKFKLYDIDPVDKSITRNDSIKNFPKGFDCVITNPPYISKKNSQTKEFVFDNLYKDAFFKILNNSSIGAVILPKSVIKQESLLKRVHTIIIDDSNTFNDTEAQTCLLIYQKKPSEEINVYKNNILIGDLFKIHNKSTNTNIIKFNDSKGQIVLNAIDSRKTQKAHFSLINKNQIYNYNKNNRSKVCINIPHWANLLIKYKSPENVIDKLNQILEDYRAKTHDLFLINHFGQMKDLSFRKRIPFNVAKDLILKL